MSLCLLVTRQCDLRCSFCPLEFDDRAMDWETASDAIERHLSAGGEPLVKFFGGEPLLNWDLIVRVVEEGGRRWRGRGLRFELPTNGTMLDARKLAFLRRHPEVEVILSHPAPDAAALPGVWFTIVVTRACRPAVLVRGLRQLVREGYRRFNFLPAYYVHWDEAQLVRLRDSLAAAARVIRALWDAGIPVEVRNLSESAPVPLFNDMVTVDVDGSLYASNLIHSKGIEPWLDMLKLGTADRPFPSRAEVSAASSRIGTVLDAWLRPDVAAATRRADEELSGFVEELRARA
jgi:hypothetical protein